MDLHIDDYRKYDTLTNRLVLFQNAFYKTVDALYVVFGQSTVDHIRDFRLMRSIPSIRQIYQRCARIDTQWNSKIRFLKTETQFRNYGTFRSILASSYDKGISFI